jgi:hypothetical protein
MSGLHGVRGLVPAEKIIMSVDLVEEGAVGACGRDIRPGVRMAKSTPHSSLPRSG